MILTAAEKLSIKNQQHLLFPFFYLQFAVTARPVQMSEGQRFLSPMSGLLFGTTCCLAQPCPKGVRSGRGRAGGPASRAGDDLSPSVCRCAPSKSLLSASACDSRCGLSSGECLGAEQSARTQRKVWTVGLALSSCRA